MTASQECCTGKNSKDKPGTEDTAKAADSVLKWGGGHANKKKLMKKTKRRLCQFGAECIRKDCFFYHPERNDTNKGEASTAR